MMKGKALLRGSGISFTIALLLVLAVSSGVVGVVAPPDAQQNRRADIITIDALKSFGRLERPPVMFLHELHADAIEKQNKDCQACHLSVDNQQSLKFKRLKDSTKKAVKDIYHTECISCHRETRAAGQKSGPATCGGCHKEEISVISDWRPIGMDKSLHFRHSKAQDKKCENCHHEYNEQTKQLVYAKGKEGTCRYCHGQKTEENRISMRLASHQACIDCHQKQLAKNKSAGPIKCSGCHDPNEQELIEVVKNVPRMERNQPDVVFVKSHKAEWKSNNPSDDPPDNLVPFNHQAHEQYNDTCRVCHHADLNTCVQCHTGEGVKEGQQIKLEKAMHQIGSDQSCIGCHMINQEKPECLGCHASVAQKQIADNASCRVCHMGPPTADNGSAMVLKPDDKEQAAMLLDSRKPVVSRFTDRDIPDKVVIKTLMGQYGQVEMPHRKIFKTLAGGVKDNKIAEYFHNSEGTLCQGCHHYSPVSKKPAACSSCHGEAFDARNPSKPGLMAAYHLQCMDCHQAMGLEKPVSTDCIACHKKK